MTTLVVGVEGWRAGPGDARCRRRRPHLLAVPRTSSAAAGRPARGGRRRRAQAAARRLSLTLSFVLQTRKIWLIAVGPRKLPVLHAAINKTSSSTPLDLLMRQAKNVTVFTDQQEIRSLAAPERRQKRFSFSTSVVRFNPNNRGRALVLVGARERAVDHVLLDLRDERRKIDALSRKIERRLGAGFASGSADPAADRLTSICGAGAAHRERTLDGILELTDVAGPGVRHQPAHRVLRDGDARGSARELLDERLHQQRNVLRSNNAAGMTLRR